MKKRFIFLLCILMLLTFGMVSAHAEDNVSAETPLTITVTVADGLEIPENGLAVTVYAGNIRSLGSSGGWETSYSYPYEKLARSFYHVSDWIPTHRFSSLSNGSDTIYIYPDTRSATAELSVTGYGYSYIAWHTQKSSGYIGSGGQRINPNATEASITISYVKGTKLSGTVTVPKADKDVAYHISIMGDVSEKPEIEYDYTFSEGDTLKAGETTFEYSAYVRPDIDYTVYLTFNDTYKIQQKDIHIGTADTTLDFTAEMANKITGTIKLPEDYTSFTTVDGETEEEVQFYICLQDASAPHDLIDACGVILTPSNRSEDFEIDNISDADEVIVYYDVSYPGDITDLCEGAAYRDNTSCTMNVNEAAVLKNENQSIDINILEGKTVYLNVQNQSPIHGNEYFDTLRAYLMDGSGAYVTACRDTYTENRFYLTVPKNCEAYILSMALGGDKIGVYYSENGSVKDRSKATPISASETGKTVVFDAYEPDLPVTYKVTEPSGTSKVYKVDYDNTSDFDIENVYVYTVMQYNDGEIEIDRDRPQTLRHGANVHNEIGVPDTCDKVYMLIWDENMRPLCEKIVIKDNTAD